jgi:hypothetical protein
MSMAHPPLQKVVRGSLVAPGQKAGLASCRQSWLAWLTSSLRLYAMPSRMTRIEQ